MELLSRVIVYSQYSFITIGEKSKEKYSRADHPLLVDTAPICAKTGILIPTHLSFVSKTFFFPSGKQPNTQENSDACDLEKASGQKAVLPKFTSDISTTGTAVAIYKT